MPINSSITGSRQKKEAGFGFFLDLAFCNTFLISQVILGLLLSSVFQLAFVFLTQYIVDAGIKLRDLNLIYLILLFQIFLFIGKAVVDIIKNWLLIYIGNQIHISLLSDFIFRLMLLPVSFFTTQKTGEIIQRINDNHRIENFLTGSSIRFLSTLFSLLLFSFILAKYNLQIFLVFLSGNLIYLFWIILFLKKRAGMDNTLFKLNSKNQNKLIELIRGMQEIKLYNAENSLRSQWESIQAQLCIYGLKWYNVSQLQNTGSSLINELKNILILFLSAKLVLNNEITLGIMLSISFIMGQLNSTVIEIINFVQQYQDAKLSLQRLLDIEKESLEEHPVFLHSPVENSHLRFENVSFMYPSTDSPALKNISIEIQKNKVTAIIGPSGSGKSTLMMLLLKFFPPTKGSIYFGNKDFSDISAADWRQKASPMMQNGYIFSDTIANNIALGAYEVDKERVIKAAETANIKQFIENLPLQYDTVIGPEGLGLSAGQNQRIQIARAVYKNSDYLFFDEATSALDTTNESIIMENLSRFFRNKTVVIIAHRLTTVKNADQIILMEDGKIIETGNHNELIEKKGLYFGFVERQLELK